MDVESAGQAGSPGVPSHPPRWLWSAYASAPQVLPQGRAQLWEPQPDTLGSPLAPSDLVLTGPRGAPSLRSPSSPCPPVNLSEPVPITWA